MGECSGRSNAHCRALWIQAARYLVETGERPTRSSRIWHNITVICNLTHLYNLTPIHACSPLPMMVHIASILISIGDGCPLGPGGDEGLIKYHRYLLLRSSP